MDYQQIIYQVRRTIQSGYYDRYAPVRREKNSLVEIIEKNFQEGKITTIAEIVMADEKKLYFSTKKQVIEYIKKIDSKNYIDAIDLWIEPKIYSGDPRWLGVKINKITIVNDYIIDPAQMIAGDAIVLKYELIKQANVNLHKLIDFAHESDFETILEINDEKEFEEAKKTETDIILINNGQELTPNKTIEILNKTKTTRPIIIKNGIFNEQDIRNLIKKDIKAIEIGYEYSNDYEKLEQKINQICSSIKGINSSEKQKTILIK
jgi:indole-3-glycerol phosphate synthase